MLCSSKPNQVEDWVSGRKMIVDFQRTRDKYSRLGSLLKAIITWAINVPRFLSASKLIFNYNSRLDESSLKSNRKLFRFPNFAPRVYNFWFTCANVKLFYFTSITISIDIFIDCAIISSRTFSSFCAHSQTNQSGLRYKKRFSMWSMLSIFHCKQVFWLLINAMQDRR